MGIFLICGYTGKKDKMNKKLATILLLVMCCTTLTACFGGDNNKKGSSSGENNSIVVGIQNDLDSLDPHLAETAGTREVLYNIFEGLVKPDKNGNLVSAVASEYKVSEDGTVYTFTLRENVKFHNGEAVTAEDVKYTIERNAGMIDGGDVLVSAFAKISSVNIVDPSTVEVVLSEADTEFISYMTVAIIPKDYDDQAANPVGTGPFKFVSYTPQQNFKIEKFADYWGEGAEIENVEFRIVQNTDSVILDLKAGSIDIYPYLTDSQAAELSGTMNIEAGNSNLTQALYLNNANEIFSNKLVRQAMYYAIDREEIMSIVSGGKGTMLGSALYSGFGKYYTDLSGDYKCDVEKAKELLKEAGYENGFSFTIKIPSNYQFHVSTGEVIVEQLKEVGITANIELIDWTTWLNDVYTNRDFEATIIGIDAKLAPSDMMLRYKSDYSKNFCNYNNAEYDDVLAKAMATTDEEEKTQYYHQLQQILSDDAAAIFIQDPPTLVAMNKNLTGFTFYPIFVQDMSVIKFQ